MSVLEHFEHAVHCAILLHRRLNEHVTRQKTLFDENRLDDMAGEIKNGNLIEQELKKANETVASLLVAIRARSNTIDDNQKKFLAGLLSSLRTTIRETMSIIDRTGTMLQVMKRETAREIRDLDTRRRAITSYSRNAMSTNYREMSR